MPAVTFKQSDLTRAVKAARAADLPVAGVEITRDGTIRVLTIVDGNKNPPQSGPEPWGDD